MDLRIAHAVTDEDENVFGSCREGGRPVAVQGVLLIDTLSEKPERGEKEQGAKKIADKLDSFFISFSLSKTYRKSAKDLSDSCQKIEKGR